MACLYYHNTQEMSTRVKLPGYYSTNMFNKHTLSLYFKSQMKLLIFFLILVFLTDNLESHFPPMKIKLEKMCFDFEALLCPCSV